MVLLSPGLALFLYGISTIPETGTFFATKVVVPVVIGTVLIVAFVPWALARRNIHPLIDLRLFQNRNMTFAVIAMSLFAISFFGAGLLFPLYFQQVRGEDALHAGLLLAPQGFGAMITMPIAGDPRRQDRPRQDRDRRHHRHHVGLAHVRDARPTPRRTAS